MKLIFICSPYRGDVVTNSAKAKRYCHFVLTKGAVPYAPHLHNTQFLMEDIPDEREAGIALGLEMLKKSDEVWVFSKPISTGMAIEISTAKKTGIPIRYFNDKCEEEINYE